MKQYKRRNTVDTLCSICNIRTVAKTGFHKNGDVKYRKECYYCRDKRRAFRSRNIRSLAIVKYKLDISICTLCEWRGNCDIHHLDRNRGNNKQDNLLIICPNCHRNIHHPL